MRLAPLVVVLAASPRSSAAGEPIAVVGATVLPQDGPAIDDAVVVFEGETITAVGSRATTHVPAAARTIDGRGRFLVPGLIDMHVHLPLDRSMGSDRQLLLDLFILHGVTTVRDMGNDLAAVTSLAARIRARELLGPEILYVGPIFDGPRPYFPTITEITTDPGEVPRLVARLKAAGSCGVKVYEGLDRPVYDAFVREAKAAGLPVVGHVPSKVGALHCAESWQHTIEHLSHFALAIGVHPEPGPREGVTGWSLVDEAKECALLEKLAAREVHLVPTELAVRNMSLELRGRRPREVAEAALLPKLAKEIYWQPWGYPRADAATDALADRALARRVEFLRKAHRAGVPVLVGSDTPNPGVVPGASLHEELELVVRALGPVETLRAATRGNARALAREDLGRIAKGARADLLLLREDPRRDARATRAIEAVVVRGRVLDRRALDGLKDRITRAVSILDERPPPGFAWIEGPETEGEVRLEGRLGSHPPTTWTRLQATKTPAGELELRARSFLTVFDPTEEEETLSLDAHGKLVRYGFRTSARSTREATVLLADGGLEVTLATGASARERHVVPSGELVALRRGGLLLAHQLRGLGLARSASRKLVVRAIDPYTHSLTLAEPTEWTVTRTDDRTFAIQAPRPGGVVDRFRLSVDRRGLIVASRFETPMGPFEQRPVKRFF